MSKNLSLSQRALLTFIGNMIVQAAEFLTGFFITPIIIRGLGPNLYGAWGMLQQMLGYFSLSELRSTTSLRFLLSLRQHRENDTEEKQRLIGSTLLLWAFSMPISIAFGIGLVWFLPNIIRAGSENIAGIRVALIVLLFNSVLDRILSIPMHILKAQNMDYAGMGVNTATVLIGSLLSGWAVWMGWGLPGLATATMANILLISIGRFWVAQRAIPWMAVKKPTNIEFIHFAQTSGWLSFSLIANLLLYSTDTLLVGAILKPAIAAAYATSGAVLRMIGEPIYQIVGAGTAGLVGLCGQQDWSRVSSIRKEMYFLLIFFMMILGTGIITLNRSFLTLWLGKDYYGGAFLTLFLVISVSLSFLTRIDLTIVDAMLFLSEKAWALFAAGIIAIVSGIALLKIIGIGGMAIGMAAGNFVLLLISWMLIQRRIPASSIGLIKNLIRPILIVCATFALAYRIEPFIQANNWLHFFAYASGVGFVALIIGWFMVLSQDVRAILINRLWQSIPLIKR